MLSWIESFDLTVLNTGEPTHFHIQTGSFSCIDLSVSSPIAFVDFSWKVLDDLHGSDHFPILLTTGDAIFVTRAPRWCSDKANWPLFEELSRIEVDANEMPTVEAIFYLNTIFIMLVITQFLRPVANFIENQFHGGMPSVIFYTEQ